MPDFTRNIAAPMLDSCLGQSTIATILVGAIEPERRSRSVLLTIATLENDLEIQLTTADAREIAARLLAISDDNDAKGSKA